LSNSRCIAPEEKTKTMAITRAKAFFGERTLDSLIQVKGLNIVAVFQLGLYIRV